MNSQYKDTNSEHMILKTTQKLTDIQFKDLQLNYLKLKHLLSARSLNVINHIEKESKCYESEKYTFQYFQKYFIDDYDFINERNIGLKSLNEIIQFRQKLLGSVQNSLQNNGDDFQLYNLKLNYIKLKHQLSARPLNVVNHLENVSKFHESEKNIIQYFQKYFIEDFDFINLRNIGLKSINELIGFRQKLLEFIPRSIINNGDNVLKTFSKIYKLSFKHEELEEIKFEGKLDLYKSIIILLNQKYQTKKLKKIIELHFFSKEDLNNVKISNIASCSKELVRIAINSYIKNINLVREKVLNSFHHHEIHVNMFKEEFALFPYIKNFKFNNHEYKPNKKLNIVIYKSVHPDYVPLDDIFLKLVKNLSFDTSNIFINQDFIDITHFESLIIYLNKDIYMHEAAGLKYNLKDKIQDFYFKNIFEVNDGLIDKLFTIIKLGIKKNWVINPSLVNKHIRLNNQSKLIAFLETYLINNKAAIKTNQLLEIANQQLFKVELWDLRFALNSHNQFIRVGFGYWIHKNNMDIQQNMGSIKDIAINLLNQLDRPIHVSEIYDIISTVRDASIKSINSNIQNTGKDDLIEFNCYFFGLKNKKYNKYWYSIKRYSHMKYKSIINNNKLNTEQKVKLMQKKGLPELHARYVLNPNYNF
jgi:hypothetical protein